MARSTTPKRINSYAVPIAWEEVEHAELTEKLRPWILSRLATAALDELAIACSTTKGLSLAISPEWTCRPPAYIDPTLPIPVPTIHAVRSDCTSTSLSPESLTASSDATQQYFEAADIARSNFLGIDDCLSFGSKSTIVPATRLLIPKLSHSGMARRPLTPFRRASTTWEYSCPRQETMPTPVIATRRGAISSGCVTVT